MAKSIDFEYQGIEDLEKSFEMVQKKFPYYTEQVLNREATQMSKDIGDKVSREVKGHGEKPGTLESSFRRGKSIYKRGKYTNAVLTKAPHYHLVEEGHDLYKFPHWKKTGGKRKYYGSVKFNKKVPGRKFVARYMAARSQYSHLFAEDILEQVLKKAGLK